MGTHNAAGNASVGVGQGNDRQATGQQQDGSQRESGGSGGAQMTRSLEDTHSDAPSGHHATTACDDAPPAPDTAATATTRGPFDTHGHQGGAGKTGLGVPETGANQQPGDMAPPADT
jgi:hypothetical protein